jgi:predicted CoA-substrate-specific enzyme activase
MITFGIDIGSLSTKAVVLENGSHILGSVIELTGGDSIRAAQNVFQKALQKANVSEGDINYSIATGYGRDSIPFADKSVTEITCHAAGAYFFSPDTKTIIDIGGQDSKGIKLNGSGKVMDFVMNDKCAAGTGRFLEVMANALSVELAALGELSGQSTRVTRISSMCTVFAESEIVSLIAEGCPKPDIIRGVHEAIAERGIALLKRIKIEEPVIMTGGVAKNKGVISALQDKLNLTIHIPEEPQIAGALGAAVIAQRSVLQQGRSA